MLVTCDSKWSVDNMDMACLILFDTTFRKNVTQAVCFTLNRITHSHTLLSVQ